MKNESKPFICEACEKPITKKEDLIVTRLRGVIFRNYHTECFNRIRLEDPKKLSRQLNTRANYVSLIILNLITLYFLFTSAQNQMALLALFLVILLGVDAPYLLMWSKIWKRF